jgi:hypothetical protein
VAAAVPDTLLKVVTGAYLHLLAEAVAWLQQEEAMEVELE